MRIGEVDCPPCGSGDVVVAPSVSALHFADALMMRGEYQVRPELPFVPGMEAAGRVLAVGEDVWHVRPGDRVFALANRGMLAEAVVVPGPQVSLAPESMSDAAAATFGIAHLTAFAALHFRAGLRPGETVLVTGVRGGVGRAAVHLARSAGASVLAVTRNPDAAKRELGDHVDGVVSADPSELVEGIRHLTDGRGADVVVDVVGGALLGQLMRATAWEGRAVIVGFAGGTPAAIKPGHLLVKNISVSGLQSTDYWGRKPAQIQAALRELTTLADAGALPVLKPRVFAMDQVADAIQAVADDASGRGVAIRIDRRTSW